MYAQTSLKRLHEGVALRQRACMHNDEHMHIQACSMCTTPAPAVSLTSTIIASGIKLWGTTQYRKWK